MSPTTPQHSSRQVVPAVSILAFFLAAFSVMFAAGFLLVVIATGLAGFYAAGGTACGSHGSSSSWRWSSSSRSPSC